MWIDLPGWQAQSSYVQPVAPPGTDPAAAPLVCLSFNQTWLPYVIGSLMQLVQPAAWATSDPTVLNGVLQDAQTLIQLFGAAEACTMLTFQFTDTCVLQFSLDGGATWQDVAGWPTNAPGCYTGATGATGPAGPAGGFTPGVPPIQPGQTTADLACAVAGYIAQYVIQASLSAVVTGYNTTQTALEVATGILALIPGVDVVFAAVTGAVTLLYGFVTSATIAGFTAAESDPLLLGDLTCAIYNATSGDGYVTAANFAAVEAAIAAISYTYPDVISAISEWLDALGYAGIAAAQIPGALAVVDCAGCGPTLGALIFARADANYVQLASDVGFGSGDFTLGGWMQGITTVFPGSFWYSGNVFPPGAVNCGQFAFGMVDSTYTLRAQGQDSGCSGGAVSQTTSVGDSSYHHVAMTRTGATWTIYLDGAQVQTTSAAAAGSLQEASGALSFFGVGNFNTGGGGIAPAYLNALMWNWAIYVGTELTGTQVAAWAAAGTSAAPPVTPTHFYPFSDGSGTTVADTIGGNNGTLYGTPHWSTHV